MNIVKVFARIGKRALVRMVGIADNYKVIRENGSPVYINERHYYKFKHVEVEKRLSRFQLLQLISYHFYADGRGLIKHLHLQTLADQLGCHVKTLKLNHDILVEEGYINYSHAGKGRVNISLCDYHTYHLKKHEGGYGYLTLSQDTLQALIDMKDVNALRLTLRHLLKGDSMSEEPKEGLFSRLTEIKGMIPRYLRYKKAIVSLFDKARSIIQSRTFSTAIKYHIRGSHNSRIQKERYFQEHFNDIHQYCQHELKEKPALRRLFSSLDDVVTLSFEYGLDTVLNGLQLVFYQLDKDNYQTIRNLGAYLRQVIDKNLHLPKLGWFYQ